MPASSRASCRASSWSRASGRTTTSRAAIGINALVSDEPALPAGGAVFHDTAVWVRRAAAEVPEFLAAAD